MSHVAFFQKQSPRAEAICKYQENFRFSFIETLLLHGCSPVNSLHICRASFSKFQSSSGDMCALREPLGNIMRELFYYYYLLWSFFVFCSKSIFPKYWIFFAFWWKKIRRHLVKSVLLSLVPTAVISSIARLRGRR